MKTIEGDILLATEDVIAHQCNCVTKRGKGLADVLFKQFPWADVYADRRSGAVKTHPPGTLEIRGNGVTEKPFIANLFSQYKGGKPLGHHNDTAQQRLQWFVQTLARSRDSFLV